MRKGVSNVVKGYAEAIDNFNYTQYSPAIRLLILVIVIPGIFFGWILAVALTVPFHIINSLIGIVWMTKEIVKRNLR
jgi:predicted outer membrane lipoprotein